jgi:hypothetical protein
MMPGNVDADFPQNLNGFGMNVTGRVRPRAGDFNEVTGSVTENSFGDVTPARVASAQNED